MVTHSDNHDNMTLQSQAPLLSDGTDVMNSSFNISLNASLHMPPWSILEKVIFGSWLTVSMVAAILGNLMVVVVVVRHKGMQTRTNMFLVNLAIADFLVGTLLAPFSLTTLIRDKWIFGHTMCNINGFLNNVCFITSIHTLMYISIHKYMSITRPFSRVLSNFKILALIACAWLWSVFCGILTMFVLNKVVYKERTMQCGPEYPHNKAEYLHHIIIQSTNILIPLAIMMFVYARMYCEFRQHAIRMQKNTTLQSDQIIGQQIRVTKTLFIVLACFMLCWLPYVAYSTYVSMVKDKSQIPGWTNALAYCCMYMNSGCNPIIYAWRSPSFRGGYKEILCQQPSYIVSDETVREPESLVLRFSSMLHGSFMSTMFNSSRRTSDDATSLGSHTRSASNSISRLRQATSKTARGSSIIRKDGSVILTKNGKIITVRPDKDAKVLFRDRSFAGFSDLKCRSNGVSRSLGDINCAQMSPPIGQNRHAHSSGRASDQSQPSSLTRIESADDVDFANEMADDNNELKPNNRRESSQSNQSLSESDISISINQKHCTSFDRMPISPRILHQNTFESFNCSSPVMIGVNSEQDIIASMTSDSSYKTSFAKSDIQLDKYKDVGHRKAGIRLSKSSNLISLPRYPSVEKLDVHLHVPSPTRTLKEIVPHSPLFCQQKHANI